MIICRHKNLDQKVDVEDLIRVFFIDSFDSNYVYIITPWVSSFKFSRKIIYYPYVSSYYITDVLEALRDLGVKVHMLIRCIDDFLSPYIVYLMYLIQSGRITLPKEVSIFLREQLEFALYRLDSTEKIVKAGINLKVDLGPNDAAQSRLHAKIYVNDDYALIGSSNLTKTGVIRGGNWECLLLVTKDDHSYEKVLNYAKHFYDKGYDYSQCEIRTLKMINKYLEKHGIAIYDMYDLKCTLRETLYKL